MKTAEPPNPLGKEETQPDNRPTEALNPAYRELVLQGLAAVHTGDIASEEEIQAIFERYRP